MADGTVLEKITSSEEIDDIFLDDQLAQGMMNIPESEAYQGDRSVLIEPNERVYTIGQRKLTILVSVVAVIVVSVIVTVGLTSRFAFHDRETGPCSSSPCMNSGECFDNEASFVCECKAHYSGKLCEMEPTEMSTPKPTTAQRQTVITTVGPNNTKGSNVAFYVYYPATGGLEASWQWVQYMYSWTDYGDAYHDSTFTTPSAGVYYVAMGVESDRPVSYRLTGASESIGLSNTMSQSNGGKSFGREFLVEIPFNSTLQMEYKGFLYYGAETTWSMFSMTAAMDPPVAFSLYISTPWTTTGKVNLTNTLFSTNDSYNITDGAFEAPKSGLYWLSISAGLKAGEGATIQLRKNGDGVIELKRSSTLHNGTDMISSAAIVRLTKGEKLHLQLKEGSLHSSLEYKEVAFSGLLYQPRHGHEIAWSVWMTSSWNGQGTDLDPIPFDAILVNKGEAYSVSQNAVTVPLSGVYYVHFVGGVQIGFGMSLSLTVGESLSRKGYTAARIYHWKVDRNGVDTVSHGVLLTLEAGQKVWVKASDTTQHGFYSNQNLVTGFSGFLVYTL